MTRRHTLSILLLGSWVGLWLGLGAATATAQGFVADTTATVYALTPSDPMTLGQSTSFTLSYSNAGKGAVSVEHPRTLVLDLELTRVDVAFADRPLWRARRDGRLVTVQEPGGLLTWSEEPPEMVTVGTEASVEQSFDLLDTFGIAALDPGRYRLSATWGDTSAETATVTFDVVVDSQGASADYLEHLAEDGSPVERAWAAEKLAGGGRF